MSVTEVREQLCEQLADVVEGTKWFPYAPTPVRENTGWLSLTEVSSEGMQLRMLRVQFDAVLTLGADPLYAAKRMDDVSPTFHDTLASAGAWGLTVRPFSLNIGESELFCVVATFYVEMES